MPPFQLVPQSEQDSDNRAANSARMVNCYLEPVGSEMVIKSVLGMDPVLDDQDDPFFVGSGDVRAVEQFGDLIYVVQGTTLYSVAVLASVDSEGNIQTQVGIADTLGTISGSDNATISSNDGNITITGGGRYYLWDGSTLSEPTSGAFTSVGSVSYIGGLTVLTESSTGNRLQWSDVFDPDTLDGLSFATADTIEGDLIRGMAIGSRFWAFKGKSIEPWYQNGADLVPIAGAALEYGLLQFDLLAKIPNGAFFVSSEGKVMVLSGDQPQPISSRAVETAIANDGPDRCFHYQDEGHDFLVICFRDRPAWVYDMGTGLWHERAGGVTLGPWSAFRSVKWQGRWFVVAEDGGMFFMARTNSDGATALVRQVTTKTLRNDGTRFRLSRLEIEARVGFSDLGRDPVIELEMSRDAGQTWTDPKPRPLGEQGDYTQRMVWRSLGQFREGTARLTWSDAAEIPLNNAAFMDVT